MELRNKKTGIVGELHYEPDKEYHFMVATEDPSDMEIYRTLAKLNEDWEDYKPAEPLIKDEKIRKAVRAWADANSLKNVSFEDYDDENIYFIDGDYETQIWFPKKNILKSPLDDGRIYTIAELCGEEE